MLVRCGTRMQVGGRGKPLPYEGRGLHRRGRRPAHGRARTDRRSVIARRAQPDAAIRLSCVPCRNLARVGGRFGYRPYGVPWVCLAGAGTSQAFPQWGEHKDADCHDSDIGHCLAMTELRSSCRQSVDSLNPGGAWRAARVCYPYYAFTTVFFSSALPHSSHTPGG